jgi:hypothetical protein
MMMITISFDLLLSIGMYGKEIASENLQKYNCIAFTSTAATTAKRPIMSLCLDATIQ